MKILSLNPPEHRSDPSWRSDHEFLLVNRDHLCETYEASVGYVVPTDERNAIVEVRLACHRPSSDGTPDQHPAKVELKHDGCQLGLGVTDARVLAQLLLSAADALETLSGSRQNQ